MFLESPYEHLEATLLCTVSAGEVHSGECANPWITQSKKSKQGLWYSPLCTSLADTVPFFVRVTVSGGGGASERQNANFQSAVTHLPSTYITGPANFQDFTETESSPHISLRF
jgi:hypothetical protein